MERRAEVLQWLGVFADARYKHCCVQRERKCTFKLACTAASVTPCMPACRHSSLPHPPPISNPAEGSHATFAPRGWKQRALQAHVEQERGHCSVERVGYCVLRGKLISQSCSAERGHCSVERVCCCWAWLFRAPGMGSSSAVAYLRVGGPMEW